MKTCFSAKLEKEEKNQNNISKLLFHERKKSIKWSDCVGVCMTSAHLMAGNRKACRP
jgi:hypothetical protein